MVNKSEKESHGSSGKKLMEEANNWLDDDEKGTQKWAKVGVEIIDNEDDAPMPLPRAQQLAASNASLKIIDDDCNIAPLPVEHIAASIEAADDSNGISAMKKQIHSKSVVREVVSNYNRPVERMSQPTSHTSNERLHSSTSSGVVEEDNEQATLPSNTFRRQVDLKGIVPPTSMSNAASPLHTDVDPNADAFTVLEATLVDDVIYDAIPFEMDKDDKPLHEHDDRGWCKRHARCVLIGLMMLGIVSTTTTIVVIINKTKRDNEQGAMKEVNSNSIWKQQGPIIIGNTNHGKLGAAVALSADGSMLAIGAPGSSNDMDQIGYVQMFTSSDGSSWEQIGKIIRGSIIGDNFGAAVALSADGRILAVGAPAFGSNQEDINGMPGYSRVYYLIEDGDSLPIWQQIGRDIHGESPADNFGTSISLSGDGKTVAIGAMGSDGENGTVLESGHVSIYQINDEGYVWTQLGDDVDKESQSTSSGWIMNADSNWTQLGRDILGEATEDQSGWAVSLSTNGRTIAIGSPFNSGSNKTKYSGQVRVYSYEDVTSSWVQQGTDITGITRGDQFGYTVATSADGETLAIGAPAEDANKPGYVRVYSLKDMRQIGNNINGTTNNGYFGEALTLSGDGKTVVVGDSDTGDGMGCVHVFKFNAENSTWEQYGEVIEGVNRFDYFGIAVSISGDGRTIAIGAMYEKGNGTMRIFSEKKGVQ